MKIVMLVVLGLIFAALAGVGYSLFRDIRSGEVTRVNTNKRSNDV